VSLANIRHGISLSMGVQVAKPVIHAESIFDKRGILEGPPRTSKRAKSKEGFENVLSLRPAFAISTYHVQVDGFMSCIGLGRYGQPEWNRSLETHEAKTLITPHNSKSPLPQPGGSVGPLDLATGRESSPPFPVTVMLYYDV
jgi:hypothetical protein